VNTTLSGAAVQLGDNGRVTLGPGPDPRWQGLVSFPAGPLAVPAQGYVDTALTVRTPALIAPDLYFIGFLVTPAATGPGSIRVVNQIGSFVTIDVPGPRARELKAALAGPRFVFGSRTQATLRVWNTGHAVVRFWGESDTTSSPGGSAPHQTRFDKALLPIGHVRSLTVTAKPAWPVGFVTMKVHVTYPDNTEVSTKELVVTKRSLVVNPIALAALVVVLASGSTWWALRRRRRRRLRNKPTVGAVNRARVLAP
jgi:hypothetical protein